MKRKTFKKFGLKAKKFLVLEKTQHQFHTWKIFWTGLLPTVKVSLKLVWILLKVLWAFCEEGNIQKIWLKGQKILVLEKTQHQFHTWTIFWTGLLTTVDSYTSINISSWISSDWGSEGTKRPHLTWRPGGQNAQRSVRCCFVHLCWAWSWNKWKKWVLRKYSFFKLLGTIKK